MHGCPFYGMRWPTGSLLLINVGRRECGLEVDSRKPCLMEITGSRVDYFACPTAARMRGLLAGSERLIKFPAPEGPAVSLHDWEGGLRWRG